MAGKATEIFRAYEVERESRVRLKSIDPEDTRFMPDRLKAEAATQKLQQHLKGLQERLFAQRLRRVLLILQGTDTAGKDGVIRFLMTGFNPQGVKITDFKAPTQEEAAHDYLWRAHQHVPALGEVAIFNRSYYEEILISRVEKLVPRKVWHPRYRQINDFERMLTENGTTILKLFLHISKDEQRERLLARVADPTKRWKFQEADVTERKKWDEYVIAYEDALTRTTTKWASWHIVPANVKWYRNYVVGMVVQSVLKGLNLKYPKLDLSDVRII